MGTEEWIVPNQSIVEVYVDFVEARFEAILKATILLT
jgi:hypothetical protein